MVGWKPTPFIFVHIPKCAGTSMERVLIPCVTGFVDFSEMPDAERTRHWLPSTRTLQHSMIGDYGRHFPLASYFKFTFVRNPWDRAISQIGYLLRTQAVPEFGRLSLKDAIHWYCHARTQARMHDLAACQVDYLLNADGNVDFDFIGRFESLDADFDRGCARCWALNSHRVCRMF